MSTKRTMIPLLPLLSEGVTGQSVYDAAGMRLCPEEVAWLNRAAGSYRTERPKLRRALRHALEELQAQAGGPLDMTEEEGALIQECEDALKPRRKA